MMLLCVSALWSNSWRPIPPSAYRHRGLRRNGGARLGHRRLDALEADGCNIVLLLCTGAFEGLRLKRGFLLEPDRIIPPAVAGLIGDRQLGVIVPVASQITSESGKWKALARPPIFAAASPYTDALDDVAATGVCLSRRGAQALLLDCIGFVETHRRQLAQASGLPVILPNALMAKIVGEMVAG